MDGNFPRLRRRALEAVSHSLQSILRAEKTYKTIGLRKALQGHVSALSDPLRRSFVLPDDGHMIDSKTACTIELDNCNLPFPMIALEYKNTYEADAETVSGTWFPDSTILLVEDQRQETGKYVVAVPLWNDGGKWIPGSIAIAIGPKSSIEVLPSGTLNMKFNVIEFLEGNEVRDLQGEAYEKAVRDLTDEALVLAHFCLLCNCDNVSPVRIFAPSAKLISASERRGRLPPDEYYVLDCFIGEHVERNDERGGSHASPRFHVRRGHIRRLPDGRRTWVKQCSVGDVSNGRIDKDYRVKVRSQEASA